jgi:3-oxoadipate enol-lactonase
MLPLQITQVTPSLSISHRQKGEEGTPLVFLHAFPLSSAMWAAQIDEFSSQYRVYAPDLRGIGKTSSFDAKPSVQTMASDLSSWLEEQGIYEPVILCGLSMGGYVALEFARTYPEKMRALVLADTRADADSAEARKTRNEMIAFATENTGSAVAQKMLPKLLGKTTQSSFPRLAGKVKDLALPNSGKNLARLVAAMRDRRDSTSALAEIVCPTLVIGGQEDVVSPPEVMAGIANNMRDVRHVVLEGAGHLANLERPEAFNGELERFLKEIA